MCGIYGFIGKPKRGKNPIVSELLVALAWETMRRGKDSTGFYAEGKKTEWLEKMALPADKFIDRSEYFMEACKNAHFYMGHNRWASIGGINANNSHPFDKKDMVLVHNGTDITIKKKVKAKKNSTDSEAILTHILKKGIIDTAKRIMNYSLVIYDKRAKNIHFIRDIGKPMVIYDFRKTLGVQFFASTRAIMTDAFKLIGVDIDTRDGSIRTKPFREYRFSTKGKLLFRNDFEPLKSTLDRMEKFLNKESIRKKAKKIITRYSPATICKDHYAKDSEYWNDYSRATGVLRGKKSYSNGWSG